MKVAAKRSDCPVSFSLDLLGDKWSLLIIRDMMFDDKASFGDFLDSPEGIATNILTTRLKMLEAEGFILKYPLEGKQRAGYCLTKKGIDLLPIITEIALWGAKYSGTQAKRELIAALRRNKEGVIKRQSEILWKRYQSIQRKHAC